MTLIDPTSGVGYAFGEVLPSADMTTIATQQVRALDIINGGVFTATADVTVEDTGAQSWENNFDQIVIGEANTTAITLGNSGAATSIQGTHTINVTDGELINLRNIHMSGVGARFRWRVSEGVLTNADANVEISSDIWHTDATNLTAERTYTVGDGGFGETPTVGNVLHIIRRMGGAFNILVENESAVQIAQLGAINDACMLVYTSGAGWIRAGIVNS